MARCRTGPSSISPAYLGNIGLPGQGVGFSWHYGGGGTAQSGGTAPTGMSQGRNPVKKICPASRISEMLLNPGKEFTYNGSTYTFPLVKLIYNAGNNVFSHQQDLNELARAMQNVDTVICHEPWWNGSARWADIVLGATTTLERNDISSAGTYSIDKVYAMKQVVAPQHDALDDFEIFRRLSELFGVEYAFTEGKTPMDYVKDAYAASTASKHTPFEKFWADGMARIPVPPEAHKWVRHGDFRADPEKNPLHTHQRQDRDVFHHHRQDGHPRYAPHAYLARARRVPGQRQKGPGACGQPPPLLAAALAAEQL